jgi:hypothetical protein
MPALRNLAGLTTLAACSPAMPRLQLPVDPAQSWLQHGYDHDAGPGLDDGRGGAYTYDGHDGYDFAINGVPAMVAGVPVLAPMRARVARGREGEADHLITGGVESRIAPHAACGNGVVLTPEPPWPVPGVWEVQLCHLREGSVKVTPGDVVEAGEELGLVGWSGMAEFPHVHLSVRHDGVDVDPAAVVNGAPLWRELPTIPPTRVQAGGFYERETDLAFDALPEGTATLDASAPTVTVGARVLHPHEGDELCFVLTDPNGFARDTCDTLSTGVRATRWLARTEPLMRPGLWRVVLQVRRSGEVIDAVGRGAWMPAR